MAVLMLALAIALAAGACTGKPKSKGAGTVARLGTAPLVDRTPGQFDADLATLKGRVVVINFWASWCAPCRTETPGLERVSRAFAGKAVTFIGVDASDQRSAAARFLNDKGVTYASVYDQKGIYGGIASHWQVASLPQTWLLAKDGSRALRIPRPVTETELSARISQLLSAA